MDENKKGEKEELNQPSEKGPAPEVEGSENGSTFSEQSQTAIPQESPEDALSQEEFPEDREKQKQAFYAMRKKIEELEKKQRETEEDLDFLDVARGVSTQPQTQEVYSTSEQGVFDESDPVTKAFLDQVRLAKAEAEAARREALAARAHQEDLEAWAKYPQLNPKSPEKDKAFREDVEAQYILELNKAVALGKPRPRLVEVADKVWKRYEEIQARAKEQGASEERTTQAQKEAATIEARGTTIGSIQAETSSRIEELRRRVRRGDIEALAELNSLIDPYLSSMEQ